MLDIRLIRKDRASIEKQLQTKDPSIDLTKIVELDQIIREQKTEVEQLKSKRNDLSNQIGEYKREKKDTQSLMQEVSGLGEAINSIDQSVKVNEDIFTDLLCRLPNLPMEDIKNSQDPKENVVIKEVGSPPSFSFPFKNHVELNEQLQLFDFKRGAKMTGSGWPVYKNWGARLEWALLQYMIQTHLKNGFMQWMVPLAVKKEMMYGVGQLPKFANQQFKVEDPDYHFYLIPTAEVALNSLHYDEIIPSEELNLKYIAYTPCFRREAGAAGSQERGLIRTHQFNKVEMFCFSHPEESTEVFQQMMRSAEEILQGLQLHYRNTLLVTGDMSFAAARTVDIEVWLPGQNRYYEVSSVSNCTDYQARRSNIRFKNAEGKLEYVHTLNGSGLATSRLMVALLENNQQEDGSVLIPTVLQPYLNGQTVIKP